MTGVDRTPKPCLHKRANHQHGDRVTYVLDRCRCYPCARAASVYEHNRTKRNAYGRSNYVDATPAREHVDALMAAGVGLKTIARRSTVPQGALWKLVYGKRQPDGTQLPSRRITRSTADRLLALNVGDPSLHADGARVDPAGTRRRLQALACLGWSINRLSTESGLDRQRLDRALRGCQVVASTARGVAELYERLWDQRPAPATHHDRAAVNRTVNHARRKGWASPAAWDDDTIDHPAAEPVADHDVDEDLVDEHAIELVLDGQPMQLTGRDLEVAVEPLLAAGFVGLADIAARVGSDEATIRRIRNTVQMRALRAAKRTEDAA